MSRPALLAVTAVAAAMLVTASASSGGSSSVAPVGAVTPVGEVAPVGAVSPVAPVEAEALAGSGLAGLAGSARPSGSFGPVAVASPSPAPASSPTTRRWQWPARPRPTVVRPFQAPASAYGAGHRGLDLAAAAGTAVLAVEAGRVVHSGMVAGRGTVSVEHADGLRSTYEPVAAVVHAGDVVAAGDLLGTLAPPSGVAHCGPVACLHLGARRGGDYLDPLPLLAGGRLALLPLG